MKMCCRQIARKSIANMATKTTAASKLCILNMMKHWSRKVDEGQNPPYENEKGDALRASWPIARARAFRKSECFAEMKS